MTKRSVDLIGALLGYFIMFPFIIIAILICAVDTKSAGLFLQQRIGQFGKPFVIFKLRTIHASKNTISAWGCFVRKYKIDELPQLINVIKGDMSLVGPRPDIAGYYDVLTGEERKILELKPGLTSEAALKYVNEDAILAQQSNPLEYNDTVIFPDKVRLNLTYYYQHSFWGDVKILGKTITLLFQ
ncbi:sugar transferase [Lutibacter maritimus]|uniref:Sugar transferase involved in LPS biosynthesis (Colanic, teichoic acid) n=1 Tax=Lutibacter maritimus TaxID=593133 RepID=A0A1I6QMJ3_9FLAO|nr:sugar transferase [Lutibacter maritimus]SFS53552.1 Sugar transferase involved in LPS biosynthesis (colanic, teichoic acid) [Lutibacter maritimus]